mgnify:CR=1 FL=1
MKKTLIVLLVVTMVFSMTACGKNENNSNEINVKDSLEILDTVWNSYDEDMKFPISGGDYNNSVDNAPGKCDISDEEYLTGFLGVPREYVKDIDDAASIIHMMNSNTFTAGAFHLTDSERQSAFTTAIRDDILNRQWVCGFPDTLIVVTIGDSYVISAFGADDIIQNFKEVLCNKYPEAKVLYEENLAE